MQCAAQQSLDRSKTREGHPLSALSIGSCGRVLFVGGECDCRRRLLEMGFCGGAIVEVVRRAAFGGPIEFRLRGYQLCLRDEQARCIHVGTTAVA
ncbi:ferrous iron transport protein A [soil metagenome]